MITPLTRADLDAALALAVVVARCGPHDDHGAEFCRGCPACAEEQRTNAPVEQPQLYNVVRDLVATALYWRRRWAEEVQEREPLEGGCSCHINPPCGYCVDGGADRIANEAEARAILAEEVPNG